MKITFQNQKNVKDLFIVNYKFVPKVFKNHIPPPNKGWISLHYKKDNVDIILNEFEEYKINKYKIDTVTYDRSNYIEKEFKRWNRLAIEFELQEESKYNKRQNNYNKWLSKIIESNNSKYEILSTGEVLDEFGNYIITICYTETGLTLNQILEFINENRNNCD
jgi:hypothetical protein